MNTIAVLMTVFNRKTKTLSCLHNLFSQNLPNSYKIDVFLTDDGCTDGTPEAVLNQYPQINIIKGNGSLFWNRGMIEAWKEAAKTHPEFYLLLNDDTFLFKDALKKMIGSSSSANHASVVVGTTLDSQHDKKTYGGRMKDFRLVTDIINTYKCDTFNANAVLIPNSVYDKIGMLDSTYHHGMGDYDYGLRVTESGLECILCNVPIGICDLHPSKPKWCDPNQKMIHRLKNLYLPGGNGSNPIEYFKFRYRHYGLIPALTSFISCHLHAIFPFLWGK